MFRDINDCYSCINSYPDLSKSDLLEYLEWMEGELFMLPDYRRDKFDVIKALASLMIFKCYSDGEEK